MVPDPSLGRGDPILLLKEVTDFYNIPDDYLEEAGRLWMCSGRTGQERAGKSGTEVTQDVRPKFQPGQAALYLERLTFFPLLSLLRSHDLLGKLA